MATHKSAEKRNRQNKKRKLRNRTNRAATKTAVAKARGPINKGAKSAELKDLVQGAVSMLMKTAHKGAIHWKNAARKASRLQLAFNKLNAK